MQVRSTTRGLWLALTTVIALTVGFLAPALPARAAATYKAPTNVKAVAVSGSNGLKVTWTAPGAVNTADTSKPAAYRVYYGTSSTFSGKAYQDLVATASSTQVKVLTGLSTSTTYYVWVEPRRADLGAATGSRSSRISGRTSSYKYKAPVEIFAVNATKTGVELAWRTVTGAPAYRLRAVGGGDTRYQSTGSEGTAVFKGLKTGTSYTFTVSVMQPATAAVPAEVKMSPESSAKAVRSTTPASNYDAPTALKAVDQNHNSIKLSWTAPAQFDTTKHQIRVDYAEDQVMKDSRGSAYLDGATGGTVKGLSSNTNYYLRAVVVTRPDAEGNRSTRSDRTEAILAKTRSPKGFIHGLVTGVSDSALKNYVVAAYSAASGDVNQQVTVGSDGEYLMEVRPGDYYVQVINIGTGNHTSLWARTGSNGARSRGDASGTASKLTVAIGKTPIEAPTVKVGPGSSIGGQVSCPGHNASNSCSVDVTALSDWGGPTTVIAQDRSDRDGNYRVKGLPAGTYKLRFNHSEDRFIAKEVKVTIGAGVALDHNTAIANRPFMRTYSVKIGGTKSAGRTISVTNKDWLAAVLPTERADNIRFQWYNDGSPISGATKRSYTLRSSDRGDYVKVRITYGRYGFITDTVMSKSYKIS